MTPHAAYANLEFFARPRSQGTVVNYPRNLPNRRHSGAGAYAVQATSVIAKPAGNRWLSDALQKIAVLSSLPHDWNSYGAVPPAHEAITNARVVLGTMASIDLEPSSVAASSEGGVTVSFRADGRYADIECFNTGEVLAVTSRNGTETEVWEVQGKVHFRRALDRINNFIGR